MKKLLIICGSKQPVPPTRGGAVENLVEMFLKINEIQKEFDIDVVSVFDKVAKKRAQEYKCAKFIFIRKNKWLSSLNDKIYHIVLKILKKELPRDLVYINKIKNYLKKKSTYDYVLFENNPKFIISLRKQLDSVPILLHLHNDMLKPGDYRSEQIIESCTKIITVSDYIKKCVCKVNTINVKSKSVTILNSIETDKFVNSVNLKHLSSLKSRYLISENDFVVVFSGRLSKVKGVLELIEAIKLIKNDNVKLLIIGASWYGTNKKDKYVRKIIEAAQPLKDRIIFTGYVDYKDIQLYYSLGDIAVIPSMWEEPCSLTLFESMAVGLPLITTISGGGPEVVKNYAKLVKRDQYIVNNISKNISELYNDTDLRQKMSKDGKSYIAQYNPERYYDILSKHILEVNRDIS